MTYKSKGTIIDGISRINELETNVSQQDFEATLQNPPYIIDLAPKIDFLKLVTESCKAAELKQVGFFRNTRKVFAWSGLCLEVDETLYPFGTAWEVEVEHEDPEMAKKELEAMFVKEGISFSESKRSKFGNMMAGGFL
jgi:uncharacterized protein YjbK